MPISHFPLDKTLTEQLRHLLRRESIRTYQTWGGIHSREGSGKSSFCLASVCLVSYFKCLDQRKERKVLHFVRLVREVSQDRKH